MLNRVFAKLLAPPVLTLLALTLLACGAPSMDARRPGLSATLVDRVSRELDCPQDKIIVTPVGAGGYRAVACGKRATFSCARSFTRVHTTIVSYSDQCIREEPWTAPASTAH